MAEILGVNLKTIADFMDAAQGNYRNALYISCNVCGYSKESHCGDFLFIAGSDGSPILLPISDAEQFFGYKIDYSDCNRVPGFPAAVPQMDRASHCIRSYMPVPSDTAPRQPHEYGKLRKSV